jgi:hypothetical protein
MTSTRRMIATAVVIVVASLLLIGSVLAERAYQAADRWATAAESNLRDVLDREATRDRDSIDAVRNGSRKWIAERMKGACQP